jgi:hypothetical protein
MTWQIWVKLVVGEPHVMPNERPDSLRSEDITFLRGTD